MFKGLVGESIMMVCAFCALDCVWGGGGEYWCLVLVWGSHYA